MVKYVYKNPYVLPKEKEIEIKERMRQNVVSNDSEEIKSEDQNLSLSAEKIKVSKVLPNALIQAIDDLSLSKIMQQKAIKFVCILFQKGLTEYKDLSVFVPLPAKYLEKVFGSYYHKDFFNLLKEREIIETDENYKQGSKTSPGYSKGYRINENLMDREFDVISFYQTDDKIHNQDHFKIKRTYFPESEKKDQISENCKNLSNCSIIPPVSSTNITSFFPVPPISSSYPSSTSSILHISSEVFANELLMADLLSLKYDKDKLWKITGQRRLYKF